MAESIIKNRGIKSATFSGTTDASGNYAIAPLSQGVIVAIKEEHNYIPLPVITFGNTNYAKFIDLQGSTWAPQGNKAVSGTYYYFDSQIQSHTKDMAESEIKLNSNTYIGEQITVAIPSGTVASAGFYTSPAFTNPSMAGYSWVGSELKSGTGAAAPIAVAGAGGGKSVIQFYAYSALNSFNIALYPVFKKQ